MRRTRLDLFGDPMTSPAVPTPVTAPTRDPVCGMDVDPAGPPGGTVERGRYRYHFCSAACRARFEAAPELPTMTEPPHQVG